MADQNKKSGTTTPKSGSSTGSSDPFASTSGSSSDTFTTNNSDFDTEVLDTDAIAEEDALAGTTSVGMSNSMAMSTPPTTGTGSVLPPAAENLKDQAVDKTHQVIAQTKEAAGAALGKVKEEAVSQLSTQKDKAAESLTGITDALHQTTQTFRDKNQNVVADYVDSLAGQVDKFSQYVNNKKVDELAHDVGTFARQNPALFVGSAFLLGLGLARFLKSSGTYDTIPRNEALIPVTPSPMGSPMSSPMSNPVGNIPSFESDKIRDEFGEKPMNAHGYVPGVGVTTNSENV